MRFWAFTLSCEVHSSGSRLSCILSILTASYCVIILFVLNIHTVIEKTTLPKESRYSEVVVGGSPGYCTSLFTYVFYYGIKGLSTYQGSTHYLTLKERATHKNSTLYRTYWIHTETAFLLYIHAYVTDHTCTKCSSQHSARREQCTRTSEHIHTDQVRANKVPEENFTYSPGAKNHVQGHNLLVFRKC